MLFRRQRVGLTIGLLVGLMVTALAQLGIFEGLEAKGYDFLIGLRPGQPLHPDLALVTVDDLSLDRLGRWPWPLSIHAKLIDLLRKGGARAAVFDLLIPQADRDPANNQALCSAVQQNGSVFLAMHFIRSKRAQVSQMELPVAAQYLGPPRGEPIRMTGTSAPFPQLSKAARGIGPVNVFPEMDGVTRRAPISLELRGRPYPSLMALVAASYFRVAPSQIMVRLGDAAQIGPCRIPVDEHGETLINFAGPYGTFPQTSYYELYSGHVDPHQFANKVVLIGFTATGWTDSRPTPLSPACAGVEINANLLNQMLNQSFLVPAGPWADLLLTLSLGLLVGWITPRIHPLRSFLVVGALVAGTGALAYYLLVKHGIWLRGVGLSATVGLVYALVLVDNLRARERESLKIDSTLFGLAQASRVIASSTSRENLLSTIRQEINQAMEARQTDLFLLSADGDRLELATQSEGLPPVSIPVGQGTVGWVAQEAVPLLVADASLDPSVRHEAGRLVDFEVRSLLYAPLRRKDRVVGVLQVTNKVDGSRFVEREMELLTSLAHQVVVALENAELYEKLEGRVEVANRELVRAYAEMAAQQEQREALLANMADAVIMTDAQGRLVYLNSAAENLLGLTASEVVGKPAESCFQNEELLKLIREQSNEILTEQIRLTEPVRRVLTGRAAILGDADGEVQGKVTVLSDVTLMEELSQMKTEFVSLVSHELRTPLTSIRGFVQTLRAGEESFPPESRQEFMGIVEDECDRMLAMINELLDASRIEAGRPLPLNWSQVDLRQVAEKVVSLHRAAAERHSLIIRIPDDLPAVAGDRDRLIQVLTNLVSNAIKYSPEGGEVTISATVGGAPGGDYETGSRPSATGGDLRISRPESRIPHPAAPHSPPSTSGDQEVVVSVRDQGIGFTPEQLAGLFQRYQRVEVAATRRIHGTGLGLYLAKALVEAHHGRIWAESQPGNGSTFYLSLPLTQPADPQPQ